MFSTVKVKNYGFFFQVLLVILIVGVDTGDENLGTLNASPIPLELIAEAESAELENLVVNISVTATTIEFHVENVGLSTTLNTIIIQDSIILREEMKNLSSGGALDVKTSRSASTSTYTLKLVDQNTGATSSYSITV